MPPVNSIDNTDYQVRVKWSLHGQQCLNVLAFHGRGVQDLVNDLLQPILDCITTNLLPILSEECMLEGVDVKNIGGSTAQEAELNISSANTGGVTGNSLPSTNTAVVRLKTTHPGRTGRGRMALPGIAEDNQANSELDATFIAAAVAFLACMATAFINTDPTFSPFFHWSVRSRKDSILYPISSTSVNPIVGTMRSRKVG